MVLITHDLGVIAGQADRVLRHVRRQARRERQRRGRLLHARACRTRSGLLGSLPRLDRAGRSGSPRSRVRRRRWSTCRRAARSPRAARWPGTSATTRSRTLTPTTGPDHTAACHFSDAAGGASNPGTLFGTEGRPTRQRSRQFVPRDRPISTSAGPAIMTSTAGRRPARAERAQPGQALPGALARAAPAPGRRRARGLRRLVRPRRRARRSAWSASRAAARPPRPACC